MRRRSRAAILLAIALTAAAVVAVDARPGGGETYSSGSGYDSGSDYDSDYGDSTYSGGSGGVDLFVVLLRLAIRYPVFTLLGALAVFSYVGILAWQDAKVAAAWDSVRLAEDAARPVRPALDAIKRLDPDFSSVLFEDFLFRLYATAHMVRADPRRLDELAPYVSAAARRALATRPPVGQPVTGVIVGALRVYRVNVPTEIDDSNRNSAVVSVGVEFEANYSAGTGEGSRKFAVETWALRRAVTARTRPPDASRRFTCPNCGAPWRSDEASGTQKCASCGEVVDNGRFDWQVVDIRVRNVRDTIGGLTEEVSERGTDLPTVRDPEFEAQWKGLLADDAELTEDAVIRRLHYVYDELNRAWTNGDLGAARAVTSDGLADYLEYWLDAYAVSNLHNALEDMRITSHELVKLRRDRYYDALTIRIRATGKDFVISKSSGQVVRGSRTGNRDYSEYWTLIRSAARRGAPRSDRTCGACGAPLTITMAGTCEHCGSHVTAGEFDWVLSKIEQDDSYHA